jgi:hypothetical protein
MAKRFFLYWVLLPLWNRIGQRGVPGKRPMLNRQQEGKRLFFEVCPILFIDWYRNLRWECSHHLAILSLTYGAAAKGSRSFAWPGI